MTTTSIHNISLYRDSPRSSWGFRLQGGVDIGQPLTVQRVFLGTPADGNLQRCDVILRIGVAECSQLSHDAASHLIKNSAQHLNLTVTRSTSRACSPNLSAPSTPIASLVSGHPLSGASKLKMFTTTTNPSPKPFSPPRRPYSLYQEQLPPSPANAWSTAENVAAKVKKDETDAINTQTYRTNPLVLPGAKAKHDLPTGSYLRFAQNNAALGQHLSQPAMNKISEALMLAKPGADSNQSQSQVQQSLLGKEAPKTQEKIRQSMSPAPDGILLSNKTKVVHRQYNTPINMYSTQSVGDALAGQGLHQKKGPEVPIRFLDLTKSPTYLALQDQMEGTKKVKKPVSPQPQAPITNKVYSSPSTGPSKFRPFNQDFNPMGVPKSKIHQSRSFHQILSPNLDGTSDL